MRRRIESCLAIWEAQGVTVWADESTIKVTGLDPLPEWWPEWVEKNRDELLEILVDVELPRNVAAPLVLPENRQWAYNSLAVGTLKDKAEKPIPRYRTAV